LKEGPAYKIVDIILEIAEMNQEQYSLSSKIINTMAYQNLTGIVSIIGGVNLVPLLVKDLKSKNSYTKAILYNVAGYDILFRGSSLLEKHKKWTSMRLRMRIF